MDYLTATKSNRLAFLRARDPSILTGNAAGTRNDGATLQNNSEARDTELLEDKNIQIHLRIKKTENINNLYKIEGNEIHCTIPQAFHSKNTKDVETITKKYIFTHIFNSDSTQDEIFNLIVKPKVLNLINGENFTLMSYGTSGSGKTFTIIGTASNPGIIPRTIEYLFRTLPQLSQMPTIKPTQLGEVIILNKTSIQEEINFRNKFLKMAHSTIDAKHINTYREMQNRLSTEPAGIVDDLNNVFLGVWVCFAEIYNENIFDLLAPTQQQRGDSRPKLKLASSNENTYISNLTNISISSGIEAYQILQYGLHNLSYASTSINAHSSRSHCIFTIKIAQFIKETNKSQLNYFNFSDLAGSERLKKTLNEGNRLKESNNINTSLLVLGRCISCIRDNQKRNAKMIIPFRESKLTRLFQKALSGAEHINMIVNIIPSLDMFDETVHTLNFSAMAKDVAVNRMPTMPQLMNTFSVHVQSRSTSYSDAQKHFEESEIINLQDIIAKLHMKLEHIMKYCAEQELKVRGEVIEEYAVVIQDIKQLYEANIKAQTSRHQKEMEALRNLYSSLEDDQENEIINLVSSSDEEDDISETSQKNIAQQIGESKLEVSTLKAEISEKMSRISIYNKEIFELSKSVEAAKISYDEMQQGYEAKINNLINENLELQETNSELTTQVDDYSNIMCKEMEKILS